MITLFLIVLFMTATFLSINVQGFHRSGMRICTSQGPKKGSSATNYMRNGAQRSCKKKISVPNAPVPAKVNNNDATTQDEVTSASTYTQGSSEP